VYRLDEINDIKAAVREKIVACLSALEVGH
jgi:hypothetical protein